MMEVNQRMKGLAVVRHTVSGTFPGTVGVSYTAKLRVRFLGALKTYSGGSVVQNFVKDGGTPADDDMDMARLVISNPAKTYYLNSGTSGVPAGRVFLDYMLEVAAVGGATFTLTVDSFDQLTPYDIIIGDPSTEDPSNDAQDEDAGIFCQIDYDSGELLEEFIEAKDGGMRGMNISAFAEEVISQTEK
jgi:hypothetical protein